MKLFRLAVLGLLAVVPISACGGSSNPSSTSGGCSVKAPSGVINSGSLTFGSDMTYPPQESNPNDPTGFDIDIGKAIAQKMCLSPKFINQGFDGIIPALNAKKFDAIISAMTITADRQKSVDFVPYFSAGEQFVVKKGSSLKINTLADVCGKSVAVEASTVELSDLQTQNPKCSSKITIKSFPADTEAFEQLRLGRVDAYYADSPVSAYRVKQANSDFQLGSGILSAAPEGIAVTKGNTALLDAIKSALKALEDNGSYQSILQKWGVTAGDIRKASPSS